MTDPGLPPGPLDPRRHPYRPDLAAAALKGRVTAGRFVEGVPRQVRVGAAGVTNTPDAAASRTSELLYGEVFTVYDTVADSGTETRTGTGTGTGGWAWGQNAADGYVGWVRAEALAADPVAPTHTVDALRSFIFPQPDMKAPPVDALSLTTPVTVVGEERGFKALARGGWIFARHLVPLGTTGGDPVATARRFLGVPYLWGGRTSLGIDCSGLVQIALAHVGIPAPRDSDMQRAELGTLIADTGHGVAFEPNDLVFFPGHVGIMVDGGSLIHATAFTMAVTIEPLPAVAERAGGILAVRRLG